MIEKRIIEQVFAEQFDEQQALMQEPLINRLEEELIDLNSKLAQVAIGVRRSGKSTLCYCMLKRSGVKYAYANFDDERIMGIAASDLNDVLEVLYKLYGDFDYLFLDEIQNVEGWHLFVNRLLRIRMHVVITGSNAKLLSGELATHLTGRYSEIRLFPFSFRDFCMAIGVNTDSPTTKSIAERRAAFDRYLKLGGFPELLHNNDRIGYISTLVNNILKRDIEQRHKMRYVHAFERLTHHLLNMAPYTVVASDLATEMGIKSSHTVANYIDYLKEAFLIVGLPKYSPKSKQRIYSEKIYAIDVALMDARADAFAGDNLGWRLETMVYIELLRRTRANRLDIFYYKNENGQETDFVVCKGNKALALYQFCYDMTTDKKRKREIGSLIAGAKGTHCDKLFIISDFYRETISKNGLTIQVIPAYEWMLSAPEW